MRKLPIRIRVTLAFAGVMALVLAGVGLFLYSQLDSRLNESIDNSLRSRAGEVTALVQGAPGRLGSGASLIEQEESFAQILTLDGQVEDSTPQVANAPVLTETELGGASVEPIFLEREQVPGIEGRARLLAAPLEGRRGELIAVVGASLDDRDEALTGLATLLLIGGPATLLLASLAGYWAAGVALRPVEAMRSRAAEISAADPSERLPVPAAEDELARLGRTLNEMLGRLESALERERRFVDDASHELRTPLALHKTELELALRYGGSEDELRTAIGSAVVEIDRLIQLCEDLLVVARAGEGSLPVESEALRVIDLFRTVAQRFSARLADSERELAVDGGDGVVVEGDRMRLEQALTNMVDNALRHGGGVVRIWARADGDRIELHVSDSGPGFPPEFVDRAFDRFSRPDESRTGAGAGLGLAIVETIAEAHGGHALATNADGGGADVFIVLSSSSARNRER